MNPDDYRAFWSGESSSLDICASIYGSQGFESDVVGFVWGRDLVWNENTWMLGGRNSSRDYSGGTEQKPEKYGKSNRRETGASCV
jgi:hypothetical protein